MFKNIVKNITQVNTVLEELISNYEKLKNIYNSQENLDSRSADFDIDEVFKVIQNKKHKNRSSKGSKFDIFGGDTFPATKMFWSSEDSNENIHNIGSVTEPNMQSLEIERKRKESPLLQSAKASILKESKPKIILIETYKKSSSTEKDMVHEKIGKPTIKMKVTPSKWISLNDEDNSNSVVDSTSNEKSLSDNNAFDVKKVIYAEAFTPATMWQEIANNKPINLKLYEEIIKYDTKPRARILEKSPNTKSVLVIMNMNNSK